MYSATLGWLSRIQSGQTARKSVVSTVFCEKYPTSNFAHTFTSTGCRVYPCPNILGSEFHLGHQFQQTSAKCAANEQCTKTISPLEGLICLCTHVPSVCENFYLPQKYGTVFCDAWWRQLLAFILSSKLHCRWHTPVCTISHSRDLSRIPVLGGVLPIV